MTLINGKMIAAKNEESAIELSDVNAKRLLARLIFIGKKDWAVLASDGRFDASEGALKKMHVTDGSKILDFETYKKTNFEKGLLMNLLGFKKK
jgi:hypothetical protein